MLYATIYFYFPWQLIMSPLVSNSNTKWIKINLLFKNLPQIFDNWLWKKDKLPGQKESTKYTKHIFQNLKSK